MWKEERNVSWCLIKLHAMNSNVSVCSASGHGCFTPFLLEQQPAWAPLCPRAGMAAVEDKKFSVLIELRFLGRPSHGLVMIHDGSIGVLPQHSSGTIEKPQVRMAVI